MKVTNEAGLVFAFHDSGAVACVDVESIRVSLRRSSPWSRAGANLYLRKRGKEISYTPLLGPDSPSQYRAAEGLFEARGSWAGLDYVCVLQLAPARASWQSWQWRVRVDSQLDAPVEIDLIYVQDVGLADAGPGLVNESYVSQYLERRIFEDPRHGPVLCCRQNMRASVGHPWLLIASTERALAASTDGLQLYGRSFRATGEPEALRAPTLAGELAGEASVVAIQAAPVVLSPGQSLTRGFVATYLPDHPQASSEQDLQRLPELLRAFTPPPSAAGPLVAPAPDRFRRARLLPAEDLTREELRAWFGSEWRQIEAQQGELLSFFTEGPRHVVLRAKEAGVDRPHGHILQAGGGIVPDERIMSSTAFACGIFSSHVTQGNTNFNTLLSVCTQPAAPALEGLRVFVQLADGEYLLGVPSAFEMGLGHCRWIYKHGPHCLEVCAWTSPRELRVDVALKVLRGAPLRLALTYEFDAASGWTLEHDAQQLVARPGRQSMLAAQYPEARFRLLVSGAARAYAHAGGALHVIEVPETSEFCTSIVGEVCGPVHAEPIADVDLARRSAAEAALAAWRALSRELSLSGPADISAIAEILPWYGQNALVHYLTPYGLEQFSGAAWGTRDVCQGPVELLLCQEKYDEARQVLHTLFSHQNADGGWPQWWMFDRYAKVRADGAHGDVVYWCVLALCSYIKASGDLGILDAHLPFFETVERAPISEHVDRIFELVERSFVRGTALVQFGGGDWNDSLQPVSKDLARRLISSWTVQMSYQAYCEYGEICERAGQPSRASALRELAARILADFQRHLVRDGVVAGYGLVTDDQRIDVLLHPTDATTGVRYSLLPMDRGVISGVFDRAQAEQHLTIIEQQLKGPDGARLMDRPLRYRGGPQTIFQRAESSTYFGREIGLMYVHEHLRYAETQARMGRPDAFLRALRQAIPVGYREVVPQAELRQANCYYSSSDVDFESRYDADARYAQVIAGGLPLKGGWRVYSSGPGIYVALVVTRLLGLRIELGQLILDPVLARSLDGLSASLRLRGRNLRIVYRVSGAGFGPRALRVNGQPLAFEREVHRYREGGAVLSLESFLTRLDRDENQVEIEV